MSVTELNFTESRVVSGEGTVYTLCTNWTGYSIGTPYWTRTRFTNSTAFVWIISNNGAISGQDNVTSTKLALRPIIRLG